MRLKRQESSEMHFLSVHTGCTKINLCKRKLWINWSFIGLLHRAFAWLMPFMLKWLLTQAIFLWMKYYLSDFQFLCHGLEYTFWNSFSIQVNCPALYSYLVGITWWCSKGVEDNGTEDTKINFWLISLWTMLDWKGNKLLSYFQIFVLVL